MSFDDMYSLDTYSMGQSILTFEEALQKVPLNNESIMFGIVLKNDIENSTLKQKSKSKDKIIRIRKHEMTINGYKKTLVMVRDFSDVI